MHSSPQCLAELAPLVLLPGAGTELYRGLGAVVLSGLLFAMVVTLFILPPLRVTVMDLRDGARRWLERRRLGGDAATTYGKPTERISNICAAPERS